ncbi:MAG: hypothetical protein ACK4GO_04995 [Gemmobacter sp.]
MRHDWIFDVLNDLRSYAIRNDLPALAEQAERTLRVARAEIASLAGPGTDDDDEGGAPPASRPH